MGQTESDTTRYTIRERILNDAITATTQQRNNEYGPPHQDFQRTARLWSTYLDTPVTAHDVAAMMIMLKLSRIVWTPEKEDHWLDIAGYAACGYEAYSLTSEDW